MRPGRRWTLGADVIVAQGTEAGGHGGGRGRSTLPFVPIVADLAAPTPVLAAGGIADGRGVAAALVLGAAGALIGTRFQATAEALAEPVDQEGDRRGPRRGHRAQPGARHRPGLARGRAKYPARTLGHPFLDQWRGREEELAADPGALAAYQDGVARGELPPQPVWAGEAVDLITDLPPAADLVGRPGRAGRGGAGPGRRLGKPLRYACRGRRGFRRDRVPVRQVGAGVYACRGRCGIQRGTVPRYSR